MTRFNRQALLLAATAACLAACTTMQPVELPASELQDMILSGDLTLAGQSARVVTADGQSRRFRITEIDVEKKLLRSDRTDVPIGDIVAIETAEFSLGKTALLAGGSYAVLALIAIAAAPAFLL